MASFITNYIESTATNLLSAGITAGATLAGNAVGGVGTLIENAGKAAGNGMLMVFPYYRQLLEWMCI